MIVYVPLVVFGATVKVPFASILNGPEVTGVTSVLVVVTAAPFSVSFDSILPPRSVERRVVKACVLSCR